MKAEDAPKNVEENIVEQAEEEEEPIPPAKEPESVKKRKIKRIIFYTSALIITVIVSALLSLTVFFKIDEIYIDGKTRYSAEEIISASMIKKNDNLILCNTSDGVKNIIAKFPYVEDVDIQKKLFNKIAIKITEAKPFSMIKNGERYYVLSKKGKIIEINKENKYDVPVIVGAKLKSTKVCDYAEYENQNIKKYLNEVVSLVKKYEIKDVSTVDVTSMTNIFLTKKNGFKLVIGSPENLDYKFQSAVSIINEHIAESDSGVLDVSMVDSEGARSYFKSKDTRKEESSKPAEESKQESSKTESSLTEESSEEESTEISENEESYEDEYSEDEESYEDEYSEDEESYEDEYSEDEESYEDEYSEDEESYEDEYSEDEESYEDEYSEDEESYEDEYSEDEEYYEDEESYEDDGGDNEEYTDEDNNG